MNTFNLKTPATYEINVSEFKPQNTIKAAVMIASATGVKQSLYIKFAQFLSEDGFVVYTFDYGGIGNSLTKPLKKFNTSASLWAKNDCETLILTLRHNTALQSKPIRSWQGVSMKSESF